MTDVRSPGEPLVVNLTCQNANTMFLKWLRPKLFYRTVDVYHVMYKREAEDKWEKQVVETVNNTVNHMVSQSFKELGRTSPSEELSFSLTAPRAALSWFRFHMSFIAFA